MEISEEPEIVNTSRLKSVVWNDFDRVKRGETFAAICRHCKRILSGSSTSGTSHLRNHLIRCRRRSNHDITQLLTRGKRKPSAQSTLALTNFSYNKAPVKNEIVTVASTHLEQGVRVGNINAGSFSFDHRRSQQDLARMIIMHGYPLGMVEDIGFKTFVRNLQPLFDLMTVSVVEADCVEIYIKERQRVVEELDKLPGKVSLSADRWVTNEGVEYLCLIAHYIDDSWDLKKKILNFLVIDPSQAEDSLSELIMTSLRSWDIDRKLFSLTVDNRTTYDKVVCKIRDQLCQHRFLMCEGKLFDVRCAASTVKLLVQDVLETSREITNKVRDTIRYVKSSQAAHEKFKEIVQLLGFNLERCCLSIDNPLQWNSTYVMLESALEFKEAFSQLQENDPGFAMCPSVIDWDRLRTIMSILTFFHKDSDVFVGRKNITANSYFAEICDIHIQLIEWCRKSDDFISSLAMKLKSKFDDYWRKCSVINAIAAILDPRFKMKLVEYYYPQFYGDSAPDCIGIVSECMKALYNGHAIYSPLAAHGTFESSGSVVKDRLTGFDRFLHETSQSQSTKSDLDKYLEEPLFPRSADFNILNWWKVHEPRYPVLSMMARNILGIPISKAAVESLFDIGDKALDYGWSSVKSDTLQALMCAQDWMRNDLEGGLALALIP